MTPDSLLNDLSQPRYLVNGKGKRRHIAIVSGGTLMTLCGFFYDLTHLHDPVTDEERALPVCKACQRTPRAKLHFSNAA